MSEAPYTTFKRYCEQGQLAYQVSVKSRQAVFYPRVIAPGTGEELEWKVSAGLGTVYATTVCHQSGAPSFNVALIDLDEGFRMMSRVVDMEPSDVKIGQRVKVKFETGEPENPPLPVFEPIGANE